MHVRNRGTGEGFGAAGKKKDAFGSRVLLPLAGLVGIALDEPAQTSK